MMTRIHVSIVPVPNKCGMKSAWFHTTYGMPKQPRGTPMAMNNTGTNTSMIIMRAMGAPTPAD